MKPRPTFGRTIHAQAPTYTSVAIVVQTLTRLGYKLRSEPGELPAKLSWGSLGTEWLVETTADILPVGAIPWIWKRSIPSRITVSEVSSSETSSVIRVDSQPVTSTKTFASPHFNKHIDQVVEALGEAGIPAEAGLLTDTVQP